MTTIRTEREGVMPTHVAARGTFTQAGIYVAPGEAVSYDGPPHWNYRPIDEGERAAWADAVASDPDQVSAMRHAGHHDLQLQQRIQEKSK